MKFVKQNCDPSDAENRSLPYTCYLVEYKMDGAICYDLVIPRNKTELFDWYWDRYREDFIGFKQSEGRLNPKLWEYQATDKKKK